MDYKAWEADYIRNTATREAYSRYLQSQKWDFFATITFRRKWNDSIKAHEAVWDELTRISPGVSKAFLAVERHRRPYHYCHVHGLLSAARHQLPGGELTCNAWSLWNHLYRQFGRTTVEEIRDGEAVANYCSKYVVKRLSEYGFYGKPEFWEV